MKVLFVKISPYLFGFALAYFLLAKPSFLSELGLLRYPIQVGLALLAFVAFIAVTINRSLPRDVKITPLSGIVIPDAMETIIREIEALGFSRSTNAYEVAISPAAQVVPLVDESGRIYSTVFQTGTIPARIAWDFVSILDGGIGGLTSIPTADGVALPAAPGALRQVLVDAPPSQVLVHHKTAMSFVSNQGLGWAQVSHAQFVYDFQTAMNREREAFLKHPLWFAAVALKRTITKTSPHIGAIEHQRHAARTIEAIRCRSEFR